MQALDRNSEKITAVVLAGGSSSRCETGDKRELEIGDTLLGRRAVLNALSLTDTVVVVGSPHVSYQDLPVICIQDEIPGFGPLSGLHAALSRIETAWCYLLACDMPLISHTWYFHLLEKSRLCPDKCAFLARTEEGFLEPFQALYSSRLRQPLDDFLWEHQKDNRRQSISRFLERVKYCAIDPLEAKAYTRDWQLFRSINCRQDYFDFIKNYRY